ncbi:MAG: DNRLRE domain-containing protein [Puniceicoccaceae bacterium]
MRRLTLLISLALAQLYLWGENGSPIVGAVDHGQGWYYSDWFGWFCEVQDGWVYHSGHGFQFMVSSGDDSLVLADPSLLNTWFWTDKELFPFVYRVGYAPGWFWWHPGNEPQARLFYSPESGIDLNHEEMIPLKPSAPTGLEARSVKHDTAKLVWEDNSDNELFYEVGRYNYSAQNGHVYTAVEVLPANTTQYSLSGLSVSTTYNYEVRAVNQMGYTESNITSFTTGDGIYRVELFATNEIGLLEKGYGKINLYNDGYLSVGVSQNKIHGAPHVDPYHHEIALKFDIYPHVVGKIVKRATLILWPKQLAGDKRIEYEVCAFMVGWDTESITFSDKPQCFISPSAILDAPTTKSNPVQWDVSNIVARWANGTWPNFGLLIRTHSIIFRDGNDYMTWFESTETAEDDNLRPKLVIEFY